MQIILVLVVVVAVAIIIVIIIIVKHFIIFIQTLLLKEVKHQIHVLHHLHI